MRVYQLNLFDESLSLVPRFQIERTIRAIPADWHCRLTAGRRFARIGIDVLVEATSEADGEQAR